MSSNDKIFQTMNALPGGVNFGAIRMNISEPAQEKTLKNILFHSLEGEAQAHHAAFDRNGFAAVIDLLKKNKIQVLFAVVEFKDSAPRIAGCTVHFQTVLTEWRGKEFYHLPATYAEDFCVSPQISQKFRKQTTTNENPSGLGLGTCFELERMKIVATNLFNDLPDSVFPAGLIVEHGEDNNAAIHLLNKFGANIQKDSEDAVLQFNEIPFFSKCLSPIQIGDLRLPGKEIQPNLFVASWTSTDGTQQVSATFTEAISTFTGSPVVRVQMVSNNELFCGQELKEGIASLFAAGQEEILRRKWIPDITSPETILPHMLIHAVREPEITSTIRKFGGNNRILGSCKMMPAVVKFRDVPPILLEKDANPISFDVYVRPETVSKRPKTGQRLVAQAAI